MKRLQNKPDCHELRVVATNGRVFRLKVAEIDRVLLNRRFVTTLVLFCTLLAIVDPYLFRNEVFLPWRVLFWNANGVFVVLSWYVQFRLLTYSRRLIGYDFAIPSAVMIAVSVTALLHFNYWLAGIILDMPELWRGRLYWDVLRYVSVAVVFETAVAVFLLPRLLFAIRRRHSNSRVQTGDAALTDPCRSSDHSLLEVNGRKFDPSKILYLKSAEHYVEVVLHDARELVRASLREMIDMLHPDLGVQPHRSYWVTRQAIVGLNRANGGQFLILRNGDEIPVSRHRRRDVAQWVRQSLNGNDE